MRVPIITRGTRGVDMKVNPLTLGTGKLRSATNLVFEEGGIKTRPSFKYETLGIRGQFQGATEYNLAEGISSESFGTGTGIAIVADGKISVGCEVVGVAYSCQGDVNVFPAENYIIFQNKNDATFWWDGTQLVQSPGTIEQDWDDPETDFNEVDLTPPVADIPDCTLKESNITLIFTVIDYDTRLPIENADIVVNKNNYPAYTGQTDSAGQYTINPTPRDYSYTVAKSGYDSIPTTPLSVTGVEEEVEFDPCFDPKIVLGGTQEVQVVLRSASEGCPDTIPAKITVTASGTGLPVENAQVDVSLDGTLVFSGVTNANGEYLFEAAPDTYTYVVTIEGYVTSDPQTLVIPEHPEGGPCVEVVDDGVALVLDGAETTLDVLLAFYTYGAYSETFEEISMTGSIASEEFTGTCSKGAVTLAWNAGIVEWVLSFDTLTPASGTGVVPNYEPLSNGSSVISDPDGVYTETTGEPFPNWTATIPAP